MKLIEKKDNQIVASMEIEESLANAIRRYVNQIPTLAVDKVEISKNGSALYDETIAHRVGLIVLKTEKSMNSKTEIKLKLNTKKEGTVYAGELKGEAKIVYEKIPLTVLSRGQELEFEATAKLGKGIEHTKFSPGIIFYRNLINIDVSKECSTDVVNVCPKGSLKIENGKVVVTDADRCDMCEACTDLCKKQGKDSIQLMPSGDLAITIESFGQFSSEEIFANSIEILKKDLAEIGKKI